MHEQPVLINSRDTAPNVQTREYLGLVRRRKSWIILICLGISVCIAVVVLRLPNVYRAETTIVVHPQKANENLVPTTAGESISYPLSAASREVKSPTQLAPLVDELKMYPELRSKVSTQGLALRMQSATAIEFQDPGYQRLGLIHIAFTDLDAHQAARAANRIASLFIERNIKAREQEIFRTSQFLETELGETKQQLEAKQDTLQDIKSRSITDLPESKQYHLQAVNALRDHLRISQERVGHDRQTKVDLQSAAGKVAPTADLHEKGTADAAEQSYKRASNDHDCSLGPAGTLRWNPGVQNLKPFAGALHLLFAGHPGGKFLFLQLTVTNAKRIVVPREFSSLLLENGHLLQLANMILNLPLKLRLSL